MIELGLARVTCTLCTQAHTFKCLNGFKDMSFACPEGWAPLGSPVEDKTVPCASALQYPKHICPDCIRQINGSIKGLPRAELAVPRTDAPTSILLLPDYWDKQRNLLGKNKSTCAAELRLALAADEKGGK